MTVMFCNKNKWDYLQLDDLGILADYCDRTGKTELEVITQLIRTLALQQQTEAAEAPVRVSEVNHYAPSQRLRRLANRLLNEYNELVLVAEMLEENDND